MQPLSVLGRKELAAGEVQLESELMKERHHRSDNKHPKTCTCTTCQARRIEAARPKVKKKRKLKSQRGKGSKKQVADSAIVDVMDMLGLSDDK
jgi:hypothetical protein